MGQGLPGSCDTVPPASTWASLSVAPPALGLGIATVATVQDPDVT
jgi:hypothetical protein